MLTTAVGERAVSLRQNVKNGNVPQLTINSKNEIPVPGTGWGLIAGAAALMERTGGTCGKTGWVQACSVLAEEEAIPA